jgi:hypothetical protein
MKNYSHLILLVCVFIYFYGCADKIVSEEDVSTVKIPEGIRLSKFSELQKNIFTPSCALDGCHAGPNPQHDLNLSEGKAYTNLVNIQSQHFPTLKRVLPGSKDQSVLYQVVGYNSIQLQMPPTGKISQYLIDSLGLWIDKGALND